MLIYTSPAVAGTYQFNLTYLPEFLTWNDAGAPITLLRVETQEDGVLANYNAAAIAAINGFMFPGVQAANQVILRLADGKIANRNVTITVTTAAAAAIAFFECADNYGSLPWVMKNAAILALNPTEFENFTALFIPTLAAGDRITIEFASGIKQVFAPADLLALSSIYNGVPGIIVNNVQSYIYRAVVEAAAATPAYVLSAKLPGRA